MILLKRLLQHLLERAIFCKVRFSPALGFRREESLASNFRRRFSCSCDLNSSRKCSSRIEMSAFSMPAAAKMSTTPLLSMLRSSNSRTAFAFVLIFRRWPGSRLEQLLAEQLVEHHLIPITNAVRQMIDQREGGIKLCFRRQKVVAQFVGFGEMPAATEKQILKFDVRQRTPATIILARRQLRQQSPHVRERIQENQFGLVADVRGGISTRRRPACISSSPL